MPGDPQYWAYLNAEWNAGRLTRPSVALSQLSANPRAFLEKYPIQSNFDPHANGNAQIYIFNGGGGQRPGSIMKTFNMHTTESFTVQPMPGQLGEGTTFWVQGLKTDGSSNHNNNNIDWFRLGNGGPGILLTAKLTGCTFVARSVPGQPGAVDVAHLQPDQPLVENGLQLNQRLDIQGQQTYGRLKYDFNVRSINVIGVRLPGGWKIYAQKLEKQNLSIRSVTRIFPPH
jgi:hypothetical protein